MFEIQSLKTWQAQVKIRTNASPKMGQDQVSGGVCVLCWLAAHVAMFYGNLRNLVIGSKSVTRSSSVISSQIGIEWKRFLCQSKGYLMLFPTPIALSPSIRAQITHNPLIEVHGEPHIVEPSQRPQVVEAVLVQLICYAQAAVELGETLTPCALYNNSIIRHRLDLQ